MSRPGHCHYTPGQRVEVYVTDFETPGFPEVWRVGTVSEVAALQGGLWDVLVVRDNPIVGNRITRLVVGKRGGGRGIRAVCTPCRTAD